MNSDPRNHPKGVLRSRSPKASQTSTDSLVSESGFCLTLRRLGESDPLESQDEVADCGTFIEDAHE